MSTTHNMADKGEQTSARVAFTLPISCQICLGKVKQPVVCPNQHVFCSPCMDVWLDRNQQCPSCRIPITADTPCRKVLGGVNHDEESTDDFRNKDMRKARYDLLFKDFEDEIERLQSELQLLQHEKQLLQEKVKENQGGPSRPSDSSKKEGPDTNMLMMLTKKLQDATGLYERVKKDTKHMKQENAKLKEENINLGRENQRLRLDLANRSPMKFGRYTVVAMEAKMETYEKEMKQLQRALERSDGYIENIEKELEEYRKCVQSATSCPNCQTKIALDVVSPKKVDLPSSSDSGKHSKSALDPSKSDLDPGFIVSSSNTNEQQKGPSTSSGVKLPTGFGSFYGKKPSTPVKDGVKIATLSDRACFAKPRTPTGKSAIGKHKSSPSKARKLDDSSFSLELPSPMAPSSSNSQVVFTSKDSSNICMSASQCVAPSESSSQILDSSTKKGDCFDDPDKTVDSTVESCRKKLRFEVSSLSENFLEPSDKSLNATQSSLDCSKQVTFNSDVISRDITPADSTSSLAETFDLPRPSTSNGSSYKSTNHKTDKLFDDTEETSNLDMSTTSDIEDCLKLLNEAEKKVGQTKPVATSMSSMATWDIGPTSSTSVSTTVPNFSVHSNSAPVVRSQVSSSFGIMPSGGQHPNQVPSSSFNRSGNVSFIPPSFNFANPKRSSPFNQSNFEGAEKPNSSKPLITGTSFHSNVPEWLQTPSANAPVVTVSNSSVPTTSRDFGGFLSQTYVGSVSNQNPTGKSHPHYPHIPRSGATGPSVSNPVDLSSGIPARPASTSTLQGMLNTLASLDNNTTSNRSSSAPPQSFSHLGTGAQANNYPGSFGGEPFYQTPTTSGTQLQFQTNPGLPRGESSFRYNSQSVNGRPPGIPGPMYFGHSVRDPTVPPSSTSSHMTGQMVLPPGQPFQRLSVMDGGVYGKTSHYPVPAVAGPLGPIPEEMMQHGFHTR